DEPSLPAILVDCDTCRPGMSPCRPEETFETERLEIFSSIVTAATEPVRFTFRWVPYPTTTTSSNDWVSSCITISMKDPFTGIDCGFIPTYVTSSTPFDGTFRRLNFPSISVTVPIDVPLT